MTNIDDYQIFHDIVNYRYIKPKISGFFDTLKASSRNNADPSIINTLNTMIKENEPLRFSLPGKNEKEDVRVDLLSWYELLFFIYIIRWRMEERAQEPVKHPIFCVFSRTGFLLKLVKKFMFISSIFLNIVILWVCIRVRGKFNHNKAFSQRVKQVEK